MNIGRTVFAQIMEFCSIVPVSPVRRSLQRQLQGENVYLSGSVPLHGLRTAYVSRKPPGHRGMPSRVRSRNCITWASGATSPETHLAHANENRDWRIYADFAQVLIKIARELYANEDFGLELKQDRLRFRFNDYRSLPFSISLGQVPQKQSCGEAPYAVGSPRQHPRCDQHYQWQNHTMSTRSTILFSSLEPSISSTGLMSISPVSTGFINHLRSS